MKKSQFCSICLAVAMVVCFMSTGYAQIDPQQMKTLLETRDEALLIQTLEKPGDAPEDIFAKNLACKRLAVLGSDAAIASLVKLLPDQKQNFNARFALEAMPGKKVDEALHKAAVELKGNCAAGVIASIGNRRDASGVAVLKGLLDKNPEPVVKKAVFSALGFIANDEAAAILLAASKGPKDANFVVWAGLADAMLDAAESFEVKGNTAKALELYDAVVIPSFPVFAQKAGAYHGLLARKGTAAATLVEKLQSPKKCCFSGGLKTVREYAAADSEAICKAVIAVVPKLDDVRKGLVLRALADRGDAASRKLVLPVLIEQGKSGSDVVKKAVIQGFKRAAASDPAAFVAFAKEQKLFAQNDPIADIFADVVIANGNSVVDAAILAAFNDAQAKSLFVNAKDEASVASAKALLKMIQWRRLVQTAAPLGTILASANLDPAVRDACYGALAEAVTLDTFDLLVKALDGEKDAAKVDWFLRAACTRFPREQSAQAVIKIFKAASTEDKIKLMGLLKQIGGTTALKCIEDACWSADTIEEATKVLGEWNTPDDVEQVAAACLKIAKESPQNKYRVRGIRSFVRIPRQFNLPIDQRIAMCQTAFDSATRPEDKALVFDVFARITEVSAIKAVLKYTQYPPFKDRACSTAVSVAEKLNLAKPGWDWKTKDPAEEKKAEDARLGAIKTLIECMNEVKATTAKKDLQARAQKVIDRWK